MRQLEDIARTTPLGRPGALSATGRRRLLVIAGAAVLVALWMLGVLPEAPPLISH